MALNSLLCADVPLRTYTLTHTVFACFYTIPECDGQTDGRISCSIYSACKVTLWWRAV